MPSERLIEKTRRDFLKISGAGVFGASLSGWMPVVARAAEGRQTKSCILLWMDGGPSHKDTFDLKPDSKGAGEYRPIKTSAPGVEISEHFPKLAKLMHHAAVIRGMSTGEGAHGRAKYYLHTGYKEGVGGLNYPSLGAIASQQLGDETSPMPNFVSIGARSYGSGFLGPRHQPLIVTDPNRGVEDLATAVSGGQFDQRVGLLGEMESAFFKSYQGEAIRDHHTNYSRAVSLMKSKQARAFDIREESGSVREAYGSGRFGQGVLMARRLVETGVPFVEVSMGGWDTHQNNFDRVKTNSLEVDAAVSTLLTDLEQRGLLDSTLVVWMGDFGRTPHINQRGPKPGRDHYPKAWSMVMMGGGVKGGTVVGRTDKEGAVVEERPVSALDFCATTCKLLGIDYTLWNDTAIGRPIRIVDKGEKPLDEIIA